MNLRLVITIGVATSALALSILLVLHYRQSGGVYIGTYPTLAAKTTSTLADLEQALSDTEKSIEQLLSDNASLKTDYLDPLEKIGGDQDAPENFRVLMTGLQLENKFVATEAELDLHASQILLGVDADILRGMRYEKLDPALVVLEESFPDRDLEMSKLSDQKDTIAGLLGIIRLDPPESAEVRHFEEINMMCNLQGKKAEDVIEEYSKQIKVATKALRGVVDDMAAGRSKPSAADN